MVKIVLFVIGFCSLSQGAIVAHYHFDEAQGATTFLDSSFSGNNGTCVTTGCPVTGAMGMFNSAARFDGTDDLITVADNVNLDNTATMSFQMWFFPTTVDGQPDAILSKRTGIDNNDSYSLFLYTGNRLAIDIINTNNRASTTATFAANRWYHVTVTYDGAQASTDRVRAYINGVEDAGSPFNELTASIPNNASPLYLGMLNAGYGNGFTGLMDEVIIHNTVLSRSEAEQTFEDGRWRLVEQTWENALRLGIPTHRIQKLIDGLFPLGF